MRIRKSVRFTTQALSATALVCAAVWTHSAVAGEIVRWVDEDGVTQFTDGQFSAGPATVVQVQPANGMVVPISPETHRGGSPTVTRIAMAPKKNTRG
jgi:hypothetical protein